LRFCAIYWHFLDIVWVLLLVAFVIAAGLLKAT
jgi:heme/copper-type cytochrome/quinol oxidase subunit 3